MSLSELSDFINYDFPCVEKSHSEKIYTCLDDPSMLTVVIGAKCLDGIVLVADRKLTRRHGKPEYKEKIFGDLEHVLIGYIGDVQMFDIFRRYTVGDVMIERDESRRYTLDNLLSRISGSIKLFNGLIDCRPFKALMVSHREKPLELYHIDEHGNSNKVSSYMAIGSGKEMTDMFCGTLDHVNIKMKEFIKHAYLAIMFMNNYCPALGVGIEAGNIPDIKYLYYDKEWDKEPAKDSPQDIVDCKKYTDEKLEHFKKIANE